MTAKSAINARDSKSLKREVRSKERYDRSSKNKVHVRVEITKSAVADPAVMSHTTSNQHHQTFDKGATLSDNTSASNLWPKLLSKRPSSQHDSGINQLDNKGGFSAQ